MEKAAYWQYLKNSLEIDDFLLPPRAPTAALYNAAGELGFFLPRESSISGEERALFERMVGAMGLALEKVGLFLGLSSAASDPACRLRVVFADDDRSPHIGRWQEGNGFRVFTTHSLKNLLAKPELKRATWDHLKTVRDSLTNAVH